MTDRLSDIEARIGSVQQLQSVIAAMRGIAAARTMEASRHLRGAQAYEATVAASIGRAISLLPSGRRPFKKTGKERGRHVLIVLTAEQGFAGSFSERILERAEVSMGRWPDLTQDVMLIGDRGALLASERSMAVAWSTPMIATTSEATSLANRVMDAFYKRLADGDVRRVSLIHAQPVASQALDIVEKRLMPFDFSQFPTRPKGEPPLVYLQPEVLLERLVNEYIFAEICVAVTLSFAAENEARMRSMVAAQEKVGETLQSLQGDARRVRQEEITNEIGELSTTILAR